MIQSATDIFEVILSLECKEFLLYGCDFAGASCLELGLLLNGRDDLKCLGIIVQGSSCLGVSRGLFVNSFNNSKFNQQEFIAGCTNSDWAKSNNFDDFSTQDLAVAEDLSMLFSSFNLTDQLHLIKIPVYVIHAQDDPVVDISYGLMIKEQLNCYFESIPCGGHW